MRFPASLRRVVGLVVSAALLGCAADGPDSGEEAPESAPEMASAAPSGHIASLLADGQVVFGLWADGTSYEAGVAAGEDSRPDYVFHSLTRDPFDLDTIQPYIDGMLEGGEAGVRHEVSLRIDQIGDAPEVAAERIRLSLERGIESIVVPHIHSAEHVATVIDAMGEDHWPGNPAGNLVSMLIVEDLAGMAAVEEIISSDGVAVVFAGPGDLSRAYDRDAEATENAIQTILGHCLTYDVACGITANPDDVAMRIEQGWRVFIVTDPETITVGKAAAGR